MIRRGAIVSLSLVFAACASKPQATELDRKKLAAQIPAELRGSGFPDGGTAVKPGGNFNPAAITKQEDIAWTDPDNPDAGVPELDKVLATPKKGEWLESEAMARRQAARENKLMLIFFCDSARNTLSKNLDEELLSSPDFDAWAKDKFIKLRVDANERGGSKDLSFKEQEERAAFLRNQMTELQKRYKVIGQPAVIILTPDGDVSGRYRGYKTGQRDWFWGVIKQGEVAASKRRADWRKEMEGKGYREWQDRQGRKVFAKLTSYHQGELTLVEPDGLRSKTQESRLSEQDRAWIQQQKAARGMQ